MVPSIFISGDISRFSWLKLISDVSDLRVKIWGCIVTKRSGNTSSGRASNTFVCVLSVSFMHAWILSLLGVLTLNQKKTQWKIQLLILDALKWYYDQKVILSFLLYFESMYHRHLPCLILSHDFDEKSDFLNYEFSKRSPAIGGFHVTSWPPRWWTKTKDF